MAKKKKKQKGGKKGKNTPPQIVIQQLVTRPANRGRADIQDWRSAHKAAESSMHQIRVKLYDLYHDILLDPVLSGALNKRIQAVTNTKLRFVRDNKEVEEIMNITQTEHFKEILKEVMKSKFWGITVMDIPFMDGLPKPFNVDRKHIRPKKGEIVERQYDQSGFNYREGKYQNTVLEVGHPEDLGLLVKAVPYVLWKRGCMGDWAQLSELYGHPIKVARYSGHDPQTKQALEQAMDEAGASLSMSIPDEAKLELLESKNAAANADMYDKLRNACNEEMLILILGQTGTTQDSAGSGYAQARVHAKTEDDINADDRDFILDVLNSKFNHILEKAGFSVQGGKWQFEDPEEDISLKDRVAIDTQLKNAGIPIDDEYFYNKYNIPKPKNYKELKKEQQPKPEPANPKKPKDKPKKGKQKKESPEPEVKEESKLMAGLKSILSLFQTSPALKHQGTFRNTTEELKKLYADGCGHDDCDTVHLSDDDIPFTDVELAKWIKAIYEKGGKVKLHQPSIDAFADAFYNAIQKGYGLDYDSLDVDHKDYEMITHLRKNVYQFATAKNKNELKLLTEAILDDAGEIRSFSDFKSVAAKITDLHRAKYMRTEYDLAVAGSQMASKWNDFNEGDLLKYSTINDSRVRPEHAALEGVVKPASDKFWDTWYPPNGWNCRCDVEVVLYASITPDEELPAPDSIPPIMRTNLAKEGLVFPKDHPYYQD